MSEQCLLEALDQMGVLVCSSKTTSSVMPLRVTDFTRISEIKPDIGERTHCFSKLAARANFAPLTVSFAA
jgi:hypothetical protein